MLVAPLYEVGADILEGVLDEEISSWSEQLCWDYRQASFLIRRYLDLHSLPGHVLKAPDGSVIGYSYHVTDSGIGYIGSLFVQRRFATRSAYRKLLRAAVRSLVETGSVRRIESQIFPFNFDPKALFEGEGFEAIGRQFLLREVTELQHHPQIDPRVIPWGPAYLNQAAEVIYDSYRNSVDYALCHDYQSLKGCLRFLNNLIHSPGCGKFSSDVSYLAVDSRGRVIGVLLTSLISRGTGMIPQVSVKRSEQGKGLGSALLSAYFEKAAQLGLERVTLSVSEANEGAFRLYRRLGFEPFKAFHAFVWKQAQES